MRLLTWVLCLSAWAGPVGLAAEDTLTLLDGKALTGRVLRTTDRDVEFKSHEGMVIKVPRDKIGELRYGDQAATSEAEKFFTQGRYQEAVAGLQGALKDVPPGPHRLELQQVLLAALEQTGQNDAAADLAAETLGEPDLDGAHLLRFLYRPDEAKLAENRVAWTQAALARRKEDLARQVLGFLRAEAYVWLSQYAESLRARRDLALERASWLETPLALLDVQLAIEQGQLARADERLKALRAEEAEREWARVAYVTGRLHEARDRHEDAGLEYLRIGLADSVPLDARLACLLRAADVLERGKLKDEARKTLQYVYRSWPAHPCRGRVRDALASLNGLQP